MDKLIINIISGIAIIFLILILVLIILKKVTKLGKTIKWFFIPVYFISWILHFLATYQSGEGVPLFFKIIDNSIITLKSFAFDFEIALVVPLAKTSILYAIAICFAWFLASLNTLFILLLAIFSGFKDAIRAKLIKNNPHYIILIDELVKLNSITDLDIPAIVICKKNMELKNQARKYSNSKYCFIFYDDRREGLLKAGIKTNGVIILSLLSDEKTNLEYLELLNELMPTYNKTFISCDLFDVKNYVDTTKNFVIYNIEDLIARDFISRYPLLEQISNEMIDTKRAVLKNTNIKHFFLGFNKFSQQLLTNLIANYQMINCKLNYYIYDKNATNLVAKYTGKFYLNQFINELNESEEKNKYYDLESSRFNLKALDYDKDSYDLKASLLKESASYNLYYIDYNDDTINFEKALELDDFLKSFLSANYKIYVHLTSSNKLSMQELVKRKINIYGETDKIFSKRILIDQSLDELAKMVNYYYAINYSNDTSDINTLWDNLSLLNKNSNRSAAMSIITKLNLLGLTLTSEENVTGLTKEEYYKIYEPNGLSRKLNLNGYNYDNKRINLGIMEHYRWNNFQIANGIRPMKKEEIFSNNTYNRKNSSLKQHSNILSLKGLLDLEKDIAECSYLSNEERIKESQILIKDFDLMDNLPDLLNQTSLKIVKL